MMVEAEGTSLANDGIVNRDDGRSDAGAKNFFSGSRFFQEPSITGRQKRKW